MQLRYRWGDERGELSLREVLIADIPSVTFGGIADSSKSAEKSHTVPGLGSTFAKTPPYPHISMLKPLFTQRGPGSGPYPQPTLSLSPIHHPPFPGAANPS